jgi:hypothetical protein
MNMFGFNSGGKVFGNKKEKLRIFRIRIMYKSGEYMDFWCESFKVSGSTYTWKPWSAGEEYPIDLGASEIEAVWCIEEDYV